MGRTRYVPRRGNTVSVRVEAPPPAEGGGLGRVIALATGVAGLVAYLYFLGGVVTWLHVTAAQLSGDAGIVATDSRRLLSTGARVAVFELLLLLLISGIVTALVAWAIWRRGKLPPRAAGDFADLKRGWNDLWTLGGMIGPAVAVLLIALGLSVEPRVLRIILLCAGGVGGALVVLAMVFGAPPEGSREKRRWRLRLAALGRRIQGEGDKKAGERTPSEAKERRKKGIRCAQILAALLILVNTVVAVVLVPILQGAMLLAASLLIYVGPFVTWPRSSRMSDFGGELVRASGVWLAIAAATVIALAWVATPPVEYPRATAYFVKQAPVSDATLASISGAMIGSTPDGVFLGVCTAKLPAGAEDHPRSTKAKIVFIDRDRLRRIEIGGKKYVFDPGGRPSLGQVILAGLRGTSSARGHALLPHTLGHPHADRVCGD
jgi:hypothetical protein